MDAFESAQRTRPEIKGADENLAAARAKLMTEIRSESRPARSRRVKRSWLVAGGLVGAAAAVAAGVLVVGSLTSASSKVEAVPTGEPTPTSRPTSQPSPEPTEEPLTPSSVFHGAALAAAEVSGPVAGEGQYLRVEHATEQLVLYAAGSGFTSFDASRADATAAWVVSGRYLTYIPADRSGEWVRVFEPEHQVIAQYGVDSQQHADEWMASVLTEPIVLRSVDGMGDRYPGSTEPLEGSDAYYAQFPREPAELLEWLRGTLNGVEANDVESSLIRSIVETLSLNAAPPDLRSALYLALDLIPGAEIVSTVGDTVTIEFRPASNQDWRERVTIDRSSGMMMGSTRTFGAGSAVVPDDVPNFRLTNTLSVVDSAP